MTTTQNEIEKLTLLLTTYFGNVSRHDDPVGRPVNLGTEDEPDYVFEFGAQAYELIDGTDPDSDANPSPFKRAFKDAILGAFKRQENEVTLSHPHFDTPYGEESVAVSKTFTIIRPPVNELV